jgi:hypothetical protein
MSVVTRRSLGAALAALTALVGLAACTGSPPAATPTPTPTPSPSGPSAAETLTLALAHVKGMNCDVTVSQPGQDSVATGSVNYDTQSATVTSKSRAGNAIISMQAVEIGPKFWTKIDFGSANGKLGLNPKKWYLVDQAKLTGANAKLFDVANFDMLDIVGLMTSTSRITRKDATHLAGTVDLTRATGVSAPTQADLAAAGAGAASVPFTATIDEQGRLVDLLIQADTVNPDLTNEYAFSNIGTPGPVTAPAPADIATTPASVYTVFNSL